ncbi:MAG: hypothetical protein P1R58_11335 [bacterium]|nr:hypothetical protein [bacterium]
MLAALLFQISAAEEPLGTFGQKSDSVKVTAGQFPVLQVRSGRIYFSAGKEDLVFSGAQFTLTCPDSQLHSGRIESSGPGISWSDYSVTYDSLVIQPHCQALIELPPIDQTTPIRISIYGPASSGLLLPESFPDSSPQTGQGNPIEIQSVDLLRIETDPTPIQAAVGLHSQLSRSEFQEPPILAPAPFAVLMIPNLGSVWGDDGSLTTSMYYRFDDQRPTVLFDGDSALPLYSLNPTDTLKRRPYPFSPPMGQALLANLGRPSDTVRLYAGERTLEPSVYYFADIIARDKKRVVIVNDPSEADVSFEFVSLDHSDPLRIYETLLQRLREQPNLTRSARETLDLIEIRLRSGRESDDHAATEYYSRLIDRALVEDIGVFPMFRPMVFLHSAPNLIGAKFESGGRIDLDSLILLRRTPVTVEAAR